MRSLLSLLALIFIAACSATPQAHANGQVQKLVVIDQKIGTGAEATSGKDVTVHYTGWLYDQSAKDKHGTKFDSSRDSGTPFSFTLGEGKVIAGWDQGVAGMKVGGKRTLLIPAALGYGDNGAGDSIPPGASLVFDVELLGVAP
jgi:FKBP-type peptidyl-prolyl cis-trans isomerase FkpA